MHFMSKSQAKWEERCKKADKEGKKRPKRPKEPAVMHSKIDVRDNGLCVLSLSLSLSCLDEPHPPRCPLPPARPRTALTHRSIIYDGPSQHARVHGPGRAALGGHREQGRPQQAVQPPARVHGAGAYCSMRVVYVRWLVA